MRQITLEAEDARRFQKLSKVLGGNDKAISFSLGLSLAVLGIHKLGVSQSSKPQNRNQPREPFSED